MLHTCKISKEFEVQRKVRHLNYAGNICLFSLRVKDVGQMALHLGREASKLGLKANINETNVLSLTAQRSLPIWINDNHSYSKDPSLCEYFSATFHEGVTN